MLAKVTYPDRGKAAYPNKIKGTYSYDAFYRLTNETALDRNGSCVASYKYTLGNAGERIKAEELNRTAEYTYDALYRLTGEKNHRQRRKRNRVYIRTRQDIAHHMLMLLIRLG